VIPISTTLTLQRSNCKTTKGTDVTVAVEVEVEVAEAVGADGRIKSRNHLRVTRTRRKHHHGTTELRGGMAQVGYTLSEHLCGSTKGNWPRVTPPASPAKGRNVGSSTLKPDAMW